MEEEWLSLREAGKLLGVSASTVRRWADGGMVPARRTPGGHRRLPRAAVLALAGHDTRELPERRPSARPSRPPAADWGVDQQLLLRQGWHTRLAPSGAGERMRGLGQRLLGVLIQYIHARSQDRPYLDEARALGITYGREARQAGAGMHDVVEAFLFFRRAFAQTAMQIPERARPVDVSEAMALHGRIDHFMDAILLGTIAGFEE